MTDSTTSLQLVWLRNDLRLHDQPALYHASLQGPVVACYAITPDQWQSHEDSPAKMGLACDLLQSWSQQAQTLNIPLKIIQAQRFAQLPQALVHLAKELNAKDLWWNAEYPLNENRRDQAVRQACEPAGIAVHEQHGDVIMPPGSVTNGSGGAYQVFTPFAKRWRSLIRSSDLTPWPRPKKQPPLAITGDSIPSFGGPYREDLWPSKHATIQRRLTTFCARKALEYGESRDIPSQPGTSTLSPYLALGAIGIRTCLAQIVSNQGPDGLHCHWVTELIWREFYRHLIASQPGLSMGRCFRPDGEAVRWAQPNHFAAWQKGQTGVPIVDAGMRQLQQTGWMHNRVRMITAAFLSKLLLIDWHLGEQHFMNLLIDGDFASNNGGWQWSASVGADAAPYFRIFNPYRQAERFDPNGEYVRKFVPELAHLPGKRIHQPSDQDRHGGGYPAPIIDYKLARAQALAAFAEAFKR